MWWRQLLPTYAIFAFSVIINLEYVNKRFPKARHSQPTDSAVLWGVVVLLCIPLVAVEREIDQRSSYIQGLAVLYLAMLVMILIGRAYIERKWSGLRFAPTLFYSVAQCLLLLVTMESVLIANIRFLPELRGKPMSFYWQAISIDKAVLSNRLFGPGKIHHMVWAGTYPYYVEGTMIDSLGKSDKVVAKYPVDENVSWDGLRGVPGHAKYDFRDTILKRNPDIIVDFTGWGKQDLSAEINRRYTLIRSMHVLLCVKNELAAKYPNLESGTCPRELFF